MNDSASSSPTYFWTTLYDRLSHGSSETAGGFQEDVTPPHFRPWPIGHPKPKYPGPNPRLEEHRKAVGGDEPKPIEWLGYDLSLVLPGVIAILAAITQKHTAANIADPNLSQALHAAAVLTLDEEITYWCGNSIFPRWHGILLAAQLGAIAEAQVEGSRQDELLQVAQAAGMHALGVPALQNAG